MTNLYEKIGRDLVDLFIGGSPAMAAGECPFCGFGRTFGEVGAMRSTLETQQHHDEHCEMPAAVRLREAERDAEEQPRGGEGPADG